MKYIIQEFRKGANRMWYVCARPGWCRCRDGSMARDGSFKGGPEWTEKREHAFEFATHRAAARVQSKCPSSRIVCNERM